MVFGQIVQGLVHVLPAPAEGNYQRADGRALENLNAAGEDVGNDGEVIVQGGDNGEAGAFAQVGHSCQDVILAQVEQGFVVEYFFKGRVNLCGRIDKGPGQGLLRGGEDIDNAASLNDFAFFHDSHLVADFLDHLHFMGDEDNGQIEFFVEAFEKLQHFIGCLRIQGRCGLVAKQDVRVIGQGSGDGDPLLLAARQLGGVGFFLVPDANDVQQFPNLGSLFFLAELAMLQGKGHVVKNGLGAEQVEVLKNHSDFLPSLPELLAVEAGQVFSANEHLAGSRFLKQVDGSDEGTLSCPRKPDNAINIASLNCEADIVHSVDSLALAEDHMDIFEFNHLFSP